jgi:hypothetical protein
MSAQLDRIKDDEGVRALFDRSPMFSRGLSFMPQTMETARFVDVWLRFFSSVPIPKDESRLTPLHFAVMDRIAPVATTSGHRFRGRVVALIDGLNISAAEFVAAAMKDNRLAVLVGSTTSGAGGDQRMIDRERTCGPGVEDPMLPCVPQDIAETMRELGIRSFSYTVTLGMRVRPSGEAIGPIENQGVEPDVALEIDREDLTDGFRSFAGRLRDVLRAGSGYN